MESQEMKTAPSIATQLVRFYVNRGMSDRLAEAILVCRYLETILDDIPSTQTGRIQPVFDYPLAALRDDWRRVLYFDLWLDGNTGLVVTSLPGSDGEPDIQHEHLPIDAQCRILFGRFAPLFR